MVNTPAPGRRTFMAWAGASGLAASAAGCASPATSRHAASAGRPLHYVLVHGSWHGAWCWNKVSPLLEAQGHRVTAIDLPGRYAAPEVLAQLKPDDYVNAVTRVLDAAGGPVVLVGHSLGGGTISLAAQARPEKVRTLVYLTAFLVPDGRSMGAIAMADTQSLTAKAVRRDAQTGVSRVDPEFARDAFYNDCSDADVVMAQRLVTPESGAMGRAPVHTTAERFGRVDRVYIECLRDQAISLPVQRSMHAALPCRQVLRLDTGHSPFLSNPLALAQALLSAPVPEAVEKKAEARSTPTEVTA